MAEGVWMCAVILGGSVDPDLNLLYVLRARVAGVLVDPGVPEVRRD